jgi:hypothetical protein
MLGKLKSLFTRTPDRQEVPSGASAASGLPDIVDPKVPKGVQTVPSFSKRTATTRGDQKLSATDRQTANIDLLTLRNGTSTKSTIHDLSAVSPDLSASVWAYQRLVVTRGFRAVAYNQDGTVNPEGTSLVQQLIARFNYLTDYTDGFSGMSSLHALGEAVTKELRLYGSCSMELVLDKSRLPNRLVPVSTTQIEFHDDGTGYVYPVQKINGQDINLDLPTFFYEALDQDLLTAYSDSPMEAALQAVLADTEFTNDVRRVIKRALHPRLDVSIDQEKFRKGIPPELLGDPDGLRAYQENYISAVEGTVNGLEPDDALVHLDSVSFQFLNNGNVTLNREYEALQGMTNAKLATGTKTTPAVLGHGAGSQNIASTETALFLRYCEGVQNKVNSIISRALTLGVRLFGVDCFVQFEFDRVDLRPDAELESFKAMKQSRILEQLSIGLISDEQAAIELTGRMPPPGSPKLSGTFFKAGASDPNAQPNPYSNTSADPGGPRDQKPQTPTQTKGPVQRVK